MAKRATQRARGLLRAAADELGITTPKSARRRTPASVRKSGRARAAPRTRR
jgi:hypothetical protein